MWEVFTEGKMPFENKSNLQVVEAISKGFRLYRPQLAPMSIYEVMYGCWHEVSVPCFPTNLAFPASENRPECHKRYLRTPAWQEEGLFPDNDP